MFKALLVFQDRFMETLRENHTANSGYFVFLMVFLVILVFFQPTYFEPVIDRIYRYGTLSLLSLALLSSFRLFFSLDLLELAPFFPILLYPLIRVHDIFVSRRLSRFFRHLEERTLPSGREMLVGMEAMMKMVERQSEQDLAWLQRVINGHRVGCFRQGCICGRYKQIVVEQFKKKTGEK